MQRNVVGIAVQGKSTAKSLETWLEHTDVPSEGKYPVFLQSTFMTVQVHKPVSVPVSH